MTFVFPRTMSSSLRSLAICWPRGGKREGEVSHCAWRGRHPQAALRKERSSLLSPSGLESTDGGGRPPREPGHRWPLTLPRTGRQHWARRVLWAHRTKLVCSPQGRDSPSGLCLCSFKGKVGGVVPSPFSSGALLRNPIVIDSGSQQLILEILRSSERLASVTHTCLVWHTYTQHCWDVQRAGPQAL